MCPGTRSHRGHLAAALGRRVDAAAAQGDHGQGRQGRHSAPVHRRTHRLPHTAVRQIRHRRTAGRVSSPPSFNQTSPR